jgi:hypothetical protein
MNGRIYTRNRCFYCGRLLRGQNSREHVFPKWLQEKFNLWDQTIHLLNGTTIQYSKLTVPCCKPCNNTHLSKLENRVKKALFGPIGVAREHGSDVFVWAMKILVGIVYAERLLPLQRSKPRGRTIFPIEWRDSLSMTHVFVQALDLKITFEAEGRLRIPGSVFVFNLKQYRNSLGHFHFRDDLQTRAVFMRLGNRGVIAVADGGAIDIDIGNIVRRDGSIKLHPIQFDELGARVFYKASLFNRVPKYVTSFTRNRYHIMQLPLAGLSSKPVFDPWDHGRYAHHLAAFLQVPVDRIASPDRSLVSTFLYDATGKRQRISVKE